MSSPSLDLKLLEKRSIFVTEQKMKDWVLASASLTSNFPLFIQLTNHNREWLRLGEQLSTVIHFHEIRRTIDRVAQSIGFMAGFSRSECDGVRVVSFSW